MMDRKTYMTVSATVFGIVALVHFFRLLNGWDVMIGSTVVPQWASCVAVLCAGALAYTGFSKR